MKTVRVKFRGRGKNCNVTRKVVTDKTVVIRLGYEQRIINELKNGNEVRLGSMESGIRLFPCLDKDLKQIDVVAQTFGSFRNILSGMKWESTSTITREEVLKRRAAATQELRDIRKTSKTCVSPDTMVTCPKCGTEFRVGKVLSAVK